MLMNSKISMSAGIISHNKYNNSYFVAITITLYTTTLLDKLGSLQLQKRWLSHD